MRQSGESADVLVVGAGIAGVLAGLAASREGLDVLLVDRSFTPGGSTTTSLAAEMLGYSFLGQEIYGGIEGEVVEGLINAGAAKHYYNTPLLPSPYVRVDRICYNPEVLKILLDLIVSRSTIRVIGGCAVMGASEADDAFYTVVGDGIDELEVQSRIVIDATSDATVCLHAGFETYRSQSERESASLLFRLSRADHLRVEAFMEGDEVFDTIQRGYEEGALPGRNISIVIIPGTNDVVVDATRTFVDPASPMDITRGVIDARSQILKIILFISENIPGLGQSGLAAVADQLTIRDCRRIIGVSTVTRDDVLALRSFPDAVAKGCAPMGQHNAVDEYVDWKDVTGVYQVPLSAMLPKGSRRVVAAGRCISCDNMAATTIRAAPVMMNTGEAAGYAAAMAVRQKKSPFEMDVEALKCLLAERGLGPVAEQSRPIAAPPRAAPRSGGPYRGRG